MDHINFVNVALKLNQFKPGFARPLVPEKHAEMFIELAEKSQNMSYKFEFVF